MTSTAVDLFLANFDSPKSDGNGGFMVLCPAHPDRNPSLHVSPGKRRDLVTHCFAGCDRRDILAALGLGETDMSGTAGPSRDEIEDVYEYVNARGEYLFEVVRYFPKRFSIRRRIGPEDFAWNLQGITERPLWKLPEVLQGVLAGRRIWVCEGEKDCKRLQAELPAGEVTTTVHGGASKWKPEHTDALRGASVIVVMDVDDAGRKHALRVAEALLPVAQQVGIVAPIKGKDVADHLAYGRPVDALETVSIDELRNGPADDASRVQVISERIGIESLADGHRATDTGNADRLVASADGGIRYVHAWRKWLVYDGTVWKVDYGDVLVVERAKRVPQALFERAVQLPAHEREAMLKWARLSESGSALHRAVDLARGMPEVLVSHTDLDCKPFLLNVANGTLDLGTGDLLAHDPEHLLTRIAPTRFDPDAAAPLWEDCVRTWQPDPAVQAYVQRLAGSALSGHPVEELSMNLGSGGNGKGKFYGGIADVLGPEYVVVPDKSLLVAQRHESHPTVVARLFGARMVVAAETDAGDRLDEAKIKELTGGDYVEARRMREDPWQFKLSATWFLHSNYRPRIRGGDEGIWRRVRLISWDVTIPAHERDDRLAEKLAAEAPGILNWLLAGCLAWQDTGLSPPASIINATQAYRDDEDHVGRFLNEACLLDNVCSIAASDLRGAYERWCDDVGEKAWPAQALGRQLTARGHEAVRRGSKRTRHWIGITLPSSGDDRG